MNKPICLFDSGIGGLTVLKKLLQQFPNEEYIYLADLANVPYGDKTKEEIKEIATNNIEWLSRFNPKIIIMACNTSSAVLHNQGRVYPAPIFPLYGMIQSLAKEIAKENYKKVSVWATKLVVEISAYKNVIEKHNSHIEVEEIACPKLVPIIESKDMPWHVSKDEYQIIQEYLEKTSNNSDALILGCTHYPLIQDDILKLRDIKIIDPTDALINDLEKHLVFCRGIAHNAPTFYATDQKEKVEKFVNIYLGEKYKVNFVDLKKVIV